jgi:hypothetical protein
MITRHNGRPVGTIGDADPLTRDRALLESQLAYKAPRSAKDALIATALGFLNRGVGGAIGGLADYELNPQTRNEYAVGNDVAATQGRIQREVLSRNQENSLANAQVERSYKRAEAEHLTREPDRLAAQSKEQERDNLRQLYNSLPDFSRSNPQHKAIADRAAALGLVLPDREAKDETTIEKINGQLLAVNRKTRTATPVTRDGQPLVNQSEVPTKVTIDGQEFTVSQSQAANALATRGQREYQREKDQETFTRQDEDKNAEAQSLLEQSQSARAMGDTIDKQLRDPGGLYAQRAEIQSLLAREGPVKETEDKVTHSARMNQLNALNSRIAQLEQGRNGHYANADKLRGQATKFKPVRGETRGVKRGPKYVAPKVSTQRLQELMQ